MRLRSGAPAERRGELPRRRRPEVGGAPAQRRRGRARGHRPRGSRRGFEPSPVAMRAEAALRRVCRARRLPEGRRQHLAEGRRHGVEPARERQPRHSRVVDDRGRRRAGRRRAARSGRGPRRARRRSARRGPSGRRPGAPPPARPAPRGSGRGCSAARSARAAPRRGSGWPWRQAAAKPSAPAESRLTSKVTSPAWSPRYSRLAIWNGPSRIPKAGTTIWKVSIAPSKKISRRRASEA